MEVHQSHGPTLFSHNRNYLMRAYPSGLRVSSSNLDPSVFWRKGVQMVALNWQKCDQGMMLNEGMFAGEGGWVLKPKGYRSVDRPQGDCVISYESQADAIAHKTLDLTVEIFAGQAIPLPIGDESAKGFHPYVKCELHVEKPEERTGKPIEGAGKSKDGAYKRRTKKKQGVDPDFEGERLEFLGIPGVVEELSFMRFDYSLSQFLSLLHFSSRLSLHWFPCTLPFVSHKRSTEWGPQFPKRSCTGYQAKLQGAAALRFPASWARDLVRGALSCDALPIAPGPIISFSVSHHLSSGSFLSRYPIHRVRVVVSFTLP